MRTHFIVVVLVLIVLAGCSDEGTDPVTTINTNNPHLYQPTSEGSTWVYDADYHVLTIREDTTINGRTYARLENTMQDPDETLMMENGNYYHYNGISLDPSLGYLYLKDNVPAGTSWEFEIQGYRHKVVIVATDTTRTVNGATFDHVIQTHMMVSAETYPGHTDSWDYGNSYYARGVGLIEADFFPYGEHIRLLRYDIK